MQTAEMFAAAEVDWAHKTVARIYRAYEALLAEQGGLDFDDLLMRPAMLLSGHDTIRDELEDRFRYVLIDEYQDTNSAQYLLARLLTRDQANLCATGDPDQSIYGWRGANIENILSFERDYPSAKVVRLEQNYRSTKRILAAADALISGNQKRKAKKLWTDGAEGSKIRIVDCETGEEEAAFVAEDIKRIIAAGANPKEIAVCYRVNSLSRTLEEAMLREGVAYQVARGVEFYNRKEIKDVLAYLRVLVNPADETALLRIINVPTRGIGQTTIDRLVAVARSLGSRLLEVIRSQEVATQLGRSAAKVQQFAELLKGLTALIELPAPRVLDEVVSRSGLRAMYKTEIDAEGSPLDNIDELISAAAEFDGEHPGSSVVDWLAHTALLSDVDAIKDERGAATLMTLHAAKGLEFGHVYMIALEDGLLPFRRRDEDDVDVEEERRLCFVGITRAKQDLTLSHAKWRLMRGVTERTVESPFLDELPQDELEWMSPDDDDRGPRRRKKKKSTFDPIRPRQDIAKWTIGTLVRHPLVGLGKVVSLHAGGKMTHLDILFRDGKRRQYILEYSELERVDFDDVD